MPRTSLTWLTGLAIMLISSCKNSLGMEFISEERDFCAAHEECFRRGKVKQMLGYMVGKNYAKLIAQGHLRSRNAWLNVHLLLHVGAFADDNWVFGELTSSFEGHPNVPLVDNSRKTEGRIAVIQPNCKMWRTKAMNETYPFACEFRQDQRVGAISRQEVLRQDKSGFILNPGAQDYEGCFRQFQSTSEIQCALRCHRDNVCRSIYYNAKTKLCVHTLYVDSLLIESVWADESFHWKRKVRSNWSLS